MKKPNTIQLRFGKGRKLTLLSYAVISENGGEQVSHETTRQYPSDMLNRMVALEQQKNPNLKIQ